ncbi:MAG: lipid-A-disaccharide synthase [Chitinispirillales bacterium]|jgi:lipid-A-disaccharide synthase|nr:lipid-A-disaccharide synthase [Chitinispirillales bacterium]
MKIFFSAGDASGDVNTAKIIAKLKQKYPDIRFGGLGGPAMKKEGFTGDFEFSKFNKMGYWEVLKNLLFFFMSQKKFIKKMKDEKPDVLVCVDFSGFNKKLVVEANKKNIKVLWFIAPMIWVWKKEKYIKFFQKHKAHIACIFPFEPNHWKPRINSVSFVGNPLLENFDYFSLPKKTQGDLQKNFTLALIPGSREQEVKKMLPFMINCALILKKTYENIRIIISKTAYIPENLYETANKSFEFEADFNKILQTASAALVTSGTASLQIGLAAIPHIVLYKTSPLSYFIYKAVIRKREIVIGLSNIVAEKRIVTEFIQDKMITENVVTALKKLIENSEEYEKIARDLQNLRFLFGNKKTSEEIVKLIAEMVDE